MKLAVGYPWSSPFMWTPFVDNTLNLQHPEGCEVKFFRGTGWCPARRHMSLCEQAVEWGAELICIIGSDQLHPEDMLPRLVGRFYETRGGIISALVPARGFVAWQEMKPFQPMAWRFKNSEELGSTEFREYRGMDSDFDMIHVIKREDGELVRANFIGSGVLLFHEAHLRAMRKPWFYEQIEPETQNRVANMDCRFVWRLQEEARAVLWVDTTILVKHLHTFEIDDTFSGRFADWGEQGIGDKDICNFRDPYEKGENDRDEEDIHRSVQ